MIMKPVKRGSAWFSRASFGEVQRVIICEKKRRTQIIKLLKSWKALVSFFRIALTPTRLLIKENALHNVSEGKRFIFVGIIRRS